MTSAWDCSLSLDHGHRLIPDHTCRLIPDHTYRLPIIFGPLQVHTLLSDSNVERQARENGHLYLPPLWLEIQLSTHIPIGGLLQWAGKPWKDEDLRKAALASCTKLFSVHRASAFPQCPSRSLPLWLALQNKAPGSYRRVNEYLRCPQCQCPGISWMLALSQLPKSQDTTAPAQPGRGAIFLSGTLDVLIFGGDNF